MPATIADLTSPAAGMLADRALHTNLTYLLRSAVVALLGVGALPARSPGRPCGYVDLPQIVQAFGLGVVSEPVRGEVAAYLEALLHYVPGSNEFAPTPDAVYRHEAAMAAVVTVDRG